jgi:hypothetical protein
LKLVDSARLARENAIQDVGRQAVREVPSDVKLLPVDGRDFASDYIRKVVAAVPVSES